MANDSLGDRMKRYEAPSRHFLPPKQPLMIRVDGRAFHTYTHGMDKPFDQNLMDAMVYATEQSAKDMSGFKLAYTQSDEASFLITDFDGLDTQGWFDYNLSKVISLSASLFTAHFNHYMAQQRPLHVNGDGCIKLATFDSRAFVIPMSDAPNDFIWRQKDWYRNSVQMLGQAHFSHKQLNGKKLSDIHDMLHEKGINWAELSGREKNGTFVRRVSRLVESDYQGSGFAPVMRTVFEQVSEKADYMAIQNWTAPPIKELVDG